MYCYQLLINLFMFEKYIFVVCLICTLSDILFIFMGIFLFTYFPSSNQLLNGLLNFLLILFIGNFILGKLRNIRETYANSYYLSSHVDIFSIVEYLSHAVPGASVDLSNIHLATHFIFILMWGQ